MKTIKLAAFFTFSLLSSVHAAQEEVVVNSFPQVTAALWTVNSKFNALLEMVKEQGQKIKNLEAATVKAQINTLKDYLLDHKLVTGAVTATVVATALYYYLSAQDTQEQAI